ncbi:MAG TPA: RDD family protein [Thermoanaerobaculia bacterium]|jgi:uncharacterized RDD family membrane protein YckC|nr:RDD family protein [Thermoanaerobaculia bacterium]
MRRQDKPGEPADEPFLFDLPLANPEELPADPPLERKRPARGARGPAEPVLSESPARSEPAPPPRKGLTPVPSPVSFEEPAPASEFASRGRRIAAGLADLLVHAAIGVAALLGAQWLGVRPTLSEGPALAVFVLAFSFLYTVLPLAFWGYTLGMAWAGISARNRDGEPLSFDQTARRWLGGLLTVLLLGIPLFVTGSRRSLTDVLSGSGTYPEKEA